MNSATSSRRLRLGLFVQPVGQHVSGWRLTEQLGDKKIAPPPDWQRR